MPTANDFLKALAEASHAGGVETVDDARKRQKSDWLQDLSALQTSIRGWLRPVIEAHLATVGDQEFPIMEPDLGQYVAPGLEISLVVGEDARNVVLRPRGMRIAGVVVAGGARAVGARGRVDIECGVAREILLRFKGDDGQTTWISFSGGEKRALDEGVFFELLANVTELKLP